MGRYTENDVRWNYNTAKIENMVKEHIKVYASDDFNEALEKANANESPTGILIAAGRVKGVWDVEDRVGFLVAIPPTEEERQFLPYCLPDGNIEASFTFIVPYKEPKYKPLNLNDEKVRNNLRGKWIRKKDGTYEKVISYFTKSNNNNWNCQNMSCETLFREWEFVEPVNGSRIIGTLDI